jgi:hypothetical protein
VVLSSERNASRRPGPYAPLASVHRLRSSAACAVAGRAARYANGRLHAAIVAASRSRSSRRSLLQRPRPRHSVQRRRRPSGLQLGACVRCGRWGPGKGGAGEGDGRGEDCAVSLAEWRTAPGGWWMH